MQSKGMQAAEATAYEQQAAIDPAVRPPHRSDWWIASTTRRHWLRGISVPNDRRSRFDSLAVEASGNVCVATLVRGGISVFKPTGELIEFYEAPEGYCTNICFGGPNMSTAYITVSGYGQLFEAQWSRPGLQLAA